MLLRAASLRVGLVSQSRRLFAVATGLLLACPATFGAVSTVGNVTPTPPAAGGNVAAPFFVGDTGVGTLTINAGTPVAVTGANNTSVGDDSTGIGIITATGFGSNLSAGSDLWIGNNGVGSVLVQSLAQVSTTDDVILGRMAGSTGNLFVDALGSIASVGDDVVVGEAGQALIQITNGGRVIADAAVVGQAAAADGTVTLSGNTSLWEGEGTTTVGDAGRGVFQVVSQARAETGAVLLGNSAGGVGSGEVNGAGSLWTIAGTLNLGVAGDGTMKIVSGGRATVSGAVSLGVNSNSEGRFEISGANSTLSTTGPLTAGNSGLGTFYILSGGRASSGAVTLGDQTAGRAEVIVDGDGSVWEITGALLVSDPGEARMTISTSARVATTGGVTVGANGRLLFGGGRLEVGSGTITNNGLVLGGGQINGNFSNSATGQLRTDSASLLTLSGALTNAGLVSLEGGQLQVNGVTTNNSDIDIRSAVARFRGGLTNTASSQVAVVGGNVDVFGAITNNAGAQIVVGGGATAVFHDAVTNNGQLVVMQGADALLLENLSLSSTSALTLQLGVADLQADAGQLDVGGAAALAGTLEVTMASGFSPEAGQSFQLLTAAGGRTGTFATEALPALSGGLSWNLDYTPTSLLLSVVSPGTTADFNGDGIVDSLDLDVWKAGAGTGTTHSAGDADGDGDVDGSDFLAWQRQLGSTTDVVSSASAVPEPTAGLMGFIGTLIAAARRRENRSHVLRDSRRAF